MMLTECQHVMEQIVTSLTDQITILNIQIISAWILCRKQINYLGKK